MCWVGDGVEAWCSLADLSNCGIATQQSPDFDQQFLRGERLEEDGAGQGDSGLAKAGDEDHGYGDAG